MSAGSCQHFYSLHIDITYILMYSMLIIVAIMELIVASQAVPDDISSIYDCLMCQYSVEESLRSNISVPEGCTVYFSQGTDECSLFNARHDIVMTEEELENVDIDSRRICEHRGICSVLSEEKWKSAAQSLRNTNSNMDIRISKAYGSRGYDKLRVSVISSIEVSSDVFSYSQPFRYRWTNNTLNTGIVSIIPGQMNSISIAGEAFDIYVPAEDSPTRGVILADPCFSNEFVWCSYGDDFDTYNRSTQLLNAINSHADNDFWMILGDNFYDQSGEPTAEWFAALSKETKSKIMGSVPGNHVWLQYVNMSYVDTNIDLSICLSVYLSIYLSICLSVCLIV